jgi:hypothetical protein
VTDGRDRVAQPPRALEPLDAANRVFGDAYRSKREQARQAVPIMVLLPGEVVVHCGELRRAFPLFRASFCAAKNVAHIAVALFSLTLREAPLSAASLTRVESLQAHAGDALAKLDDPALDKLRSALRNLLELSMAFANEVVEKHVASDDERAAFARRAGPQILSMTELATCEQITELHQVVEHALGTLSKDQRLQLQIVVVGDHQARARSLGMQYFQSRLREQPGEDERVTYGENINDEKEALALVGTRQLDRAIAGAFFGDEKRLQRDVLGDAAKACLKAMNLPPL